MKKIIMTILAAAASLAAGAQQWDSLYYRPDRHVAPVERIACHRGMELLGGDSLDVIETLPEGKPAGIVYIYHGNAENITGKNMQAAMAALTGAGYTVRTFDYPGFGRSEGTPTHEAIGEAAREHFSRTMAGTDTSTPVILYGRSIGTQIAAEIAAENDGRIAGLILDGGSPSFKALALLFAPMEVHPFIEQFMYDPYSAEEALRRLSHTKVLFIHSKDDHIPYSDARAMYDNFTGGKSFWTYDGVHIDAARLYPDEFVSHVDSLAHGM